MRISGISRLAAALCGAAVLAFGATTMQTGKAGLKSAGALAIGPDGILFVGDSVGAAIFALDVNDQTAAKSARQSRNQGHQREDRRHAGHRRRPDPDSGRGGQSRVSKNVYIAVSRGKGADAVPVILRVDAARQDHRSFARQHQARVRQPARSVRQGDRQRMETITQLKYVDGKVLVAGLSNEEFSSSLRSHSVPVPGASKGAGIEIWHGSHGRFETNAPVRTFVPYEINQQTEHPGRLHLHAAGADSGLRTEARQQGEGHHDRRTGQPQPAARHDRLHQGRQALHPDGQQQPRRHEADGRQPGRLPADHQADRNHRRAVRDHRELKGVQHLDKYDDASALVLMGRARRSICARCRCRERWIVRLSSRAGRSPPRTRFTMDGGVFRVAAGSPARSLPPGGRSVFAVYAGEGDVPPLLGTYTVEDGALVFRPRFPLSPGMHVRAVFRVEARRAAFDIPKAAPPLLHHARRARLSLATCCPRIN